MIYILYFLQDKESIQNTYIYKVQKETEKYYRKDEQNIVNYMKRIYSNY